MTQEEKQLLLKDLCARLPYTPQVMYNSITEPLSTLHIFDMTHIKEEYVDIKPYLRNLSSMTEEERKKYIATCVFIGDGYIHTLRTFEFFNENHFDYRGLIPMGLALEAPEGVYKTE